MTAVTLLTGPERRRRWSASQKAQIVSESFEAGALVTAVARRHDVHPSLLRTWRSQVRRPAEAAGSSVGRGFVPVRVAADAGAVESSTAAASAIEVRLGNGVALVVPEGASASRAAQLAAALSGLAR